MVKGWGRRCAVLLHISDNSLQVIALYPRTEVHLNEALVKIASGHQVARSTKSLNPRTGETCMNRILSLVICALAFSGTIHANSVPLSDPKIVIGRGSDSTPITSLTFGVQIDPTGGGILNFDNATGRNWTGLILTIQFPNAVAAKAAGVSCSNGDVLSNIFTACTSERHGRTLTIDLAHGEIKFCSTSPCPLDSEFFIDLNDPNIHCHNGKGGWKGDVIEAQALTAATVPEPATLLLQGIGIGGICGIWVQRKRFYRANN
jgi:hypothetical protein